MSGGCRDSVRCVKKKGDCGLGLWTNVHMDTFLFTRIVFDLLDSFKGSKSFVYICVNDKQIMRNCKFCLLISV